MHLTPSFEGEDTALHMSVGLSVGLSVGRPNGFRSVTLITLRPSELKFDMCVGDD